MDKILSLLGLAKKAGRVEAGEDAVGMAAERHGARLILLASDAAENSARRAKRFAETGNCLLAELPADKETLGRAVGLASCAMLAVTEIGFASAMGEKLAALDPERYGGLSERLKLKAKRAAERKETRRKGRK